MAGRAQFLGNVRLWLLLATSSDAKGQSGWLSMLHAGKGVLCPSPRDGPFRLSEGGGWRLVSSRSRLGVL